MSSVFGAPPPIIPQTPLVSSIEEERILAYHKDLLDRSLKFSPAVEKKIKRDSSRVTTWDTETAGLRSNQAIYEGAFMHGTGDSAQFHHFFGIPSTIEDTSTPTKWDRFSIDQIEKRQEALNGVPARHTFADALIEEGIPQQEIPRYALDKLKGRDIWTQNGRFENEGIKARIDPDFLDEVLESDDFRIQSHTPGGGLYPTDKTVRELTSKAKGLGNTVTGTQQGYLNAWEDVFKSGYSKVLRKDPGQGVSRVFELMDLTKSVYAMAQNRGLMEKNGELFTGTSVNTFSELFFGQKEAHGALPDVSMQERFRHHMLGAGHAMMAGEDLPERMKEYFRRVGESQPEQKYRNRVTNFIRSFQKQQEYHSAELRGATPQELEKEFGKMDDFVTSFNPTTWDNVIRERQPDGTYLESPIELPGRRNVKKSFNLEDVARSMEHRQKTQHGVHIDNMAAYEEAKRTFIDPYNEVLQSHLGKGVPRHQAITMALESPNVREAAAKVESSSSSVLKNMTSAAEEATPSAFKGFLRENWKIGLGAIGAIWAANKIAGDDDAYNYIEGMGHSGISGSSRKYNTDFGSGWNALRGLVRAEETFAEMLASKEFILARKASKVEKTLGKGSFGEAVLMSSNFRGNDFKFVRKTGEIGPHEIEALQKAGHTNVPDFYGSEKTWYGRVRSIDMEVFEGTHLQDFPAKGASLVQPQIDMALKALNEAGFNHGDTHFGNIMITPAPGGHKVGLIDLGKATRVTGPGTVRDAEQISSWQRLLERRDANGGVLTADMLDSKAGVGFRDPVRVSEAERAILGKGKVPGRPNSNTAGNIIDGQQKGGLLGARRIKETDFGSPWQGIKAGLMAGVFTANAIGGAMPALPSVPTRTADIVQTIKSSITEMRSSSVTKTVVSRAGDDFLALDGVNQGLKKGPYLDFLGIESQNVYNWPDAVAQIKASGRKNIMITAHGLNGSGFAIETGAAGGQVDIASASWLSSQLPEKDGYKVFMDSCQGVSSLATNAGYDPQTLAKVKANAAKLDHSVLSIHDVKGIQGSNIYARDKLGYGGMTYPGHLPRPSSLIQSDSYMNPFHLDVMSGKGMTNKPGHFGQAADQFSWGRWSKEIHTDTTDGGTLTKSYVSDLEKDFNTQLGKQRSKAVTETVQTPFTRQVETLQTIPGSEIPSNVSAQSAFGLDMLGPRGRDPIQKGRVRRRAKVKSRKNRQAPTKLTPTSGPVAPAQPSLPQLSPPPQGQIPRGRHVPGMPTLKAPSEVSIPRGKVAEAPLGMPNLRTPVEASVPRGKASPPTIIERIRALEAGEGAVHGKSPEQILGNLQPQVPNITGAPSATVTPAREVLGVKEATAAGHPNRQTSNIVSSVAEQVAEKTANPAMGISKLNKPIQAIEGAKGAVTGGGGLIAAGMVAAGGLFWAISGSSKKDGGDQFGSPWAGLRNALGDVIGETSEQYAKARARERKKEEESGGDGSIEGINKYFGGGELEESGRIWDYQVEDADTVRLMMMGGGAVSMRLAGIDAPEIKHDDEKFRVWGDQPYGHEAKQKLQSLLDQQSSLSYISDPNASGSYGRKVGMLIGDNGLNINLQMVREGAAGALPYGKREEQIASASEFRHAEMDALGAQRGMWSTKEWQIAQRAQLNSKKRTTNVSFTDLGRLYSNFKTSSILLRMRNPDSDLSEMTASGGRDDHNIIEGLGHGWAQSNRQDNLDDFGSGYRLLEGVIPSAPKSLKASRSLQNAHYVATTNGRQIMKHDVAIGHHRG